MKQSFSHVPVLLDEVIELLAPKPSESLLDVTLGLGGHSQAILQHTAPDGRLVGIDADSDNIVLVKEVLAPMSDRVAIYHGNFADVLSMNDGPFHMILADLGISSPHLDDSSRGFSFREDAPLDMRLNRTAGQTAAQLIASAAEEELARIFYEYGDIRQSRKLATLLKASLPSTTFELVAICNELFGHKAPSLLPQVFQALRIAVNDELHALETLLAAIPSLLVPGGRAAIISFHSLEDRLVKHAFKDLCTGKIDDTTGAEIVPSPFISLTKKAIQPTEAEVNGNPRSRSARLRAIQKRL